VSSFALPAGTVTRAAAPDLADYDLIAPQLSGGKDSAVMMWLTMEAARAAGVVDRVRSYHASLGLLEWPAVIYAGVRWPGAGGVGTRRTPERRVRPACRPAHRGHPHPASARR